MSDDTISAFKMRQALTDELALICDMTEAAYAQYLPILGGPPVPVTEDYAPRIERGEVWIQETGGKASAIAVIENHEDHLMIFSLAVMPEKQGIGCGQALLKWCEGICRSRRIPQLRLYTNTKMERNIGIYKQFGFEETGRAENTLRPGWFRVDMAKDITLDEAEAQRK